MVTGWHAQSKHTLPKVLNCVLMSSDHITGGASDEQYMEALTDVLPHVLDEQQPDLVMYNAGKCACKWLVFRVSGFP